MLEIQKISESLKAIVGEENIFTDEPMCNHTTFKIGGNADVLVLPNSKEEIASVIRYLRDNSITYAIIGNGSNLLVSDSGFRGVVVKLSKQFSDFQILWEKEGETCIYTQAGALLSRLGNEFADRNLTGFEFAAGIPGTVGGAVRMNAGAYGGEFKDILISAELLDEEGNIIELSNEELKLGYRTSIVSSKNYIVLGATLLLKTGDKDSIRATMSELAQKRRDKQPLEYPSAGSTFKRPEGYFAGKLIEDAGLKGFTVGGAQVSTKHSGFVINVGEATAKDVIELTDTVKDKVKNLYGVDLELEVVKMGF